MKVAVDRSVCMGTGVCVMTAGEFFDQDDDGIAIAGAGNLPAELTADDVARRVQIAITLCPSGALQLVGE